MYPSPRRRLGTAVEYVPDATLHSTFFGLPSQTSWLHTKLSLLWMRKGTWKCLVGSIRLVECSGEPRKYAGKIGCLTLPHRSYPEEFKAKFKPRSPKVEHK